MKNNQSIIFIIITAICFGTMEIALKLGGSNFTALQLTFLRFLIGGLFLLPFALHDIKKRQLSLKAGDFLYLAMLGIIGVCISMTCFQLGVMNCNANTAAVIISSNPVFTMIFAYFIVKEPFTKRKGIVLVISLIGLVLVADPMAMAEGNTAKGLIYASIAAVTFALYTALGKLRIGRLGGMVQNSGSFLTASVIELIILLVRGEPIVSGITLSTVPVVLYTGIVVTGIGYFAYLKAIELAGPSNASVAFFIKPVIAVILAAVILGESITWNIVAGVLLILIGSYINMSGAKKAAE
jgi:drug/metabolite transporter (DMT)-like permease